MSATMSSGRRRASGAVLLAACAHLCACAAAYLDYPPSMAGLYQFIGSSGGASPFFYPPPLPPYPRVSGSATFLPPWEAAAAAAEQVPGLYASRYAASALPAPAALRPWHAHAPAQTAGGAHALHEPAQRFYSGRGRPAMIPTPYAKFSKSTDKNNIIAAPTHPNALNVPEPGFYGRTDTIGAPGRSVSQGGPEGAAYHDKAAVGFYGKPLH